jgi:uncharacterized protein
MKLIRILFIVGLLVSCCAEEHKREYFENGQLKEQIPYKNNSLNGEYKAFYESGQLRVQGIYKSGKMTDAWKYWHLNGRPMSEALYTDDGELIDLQAWDESGKQTIKDCTGVAILLYPNGKPMSQVSYRKCKMHGQWITWFEDGQIESEIYYEDGIPAGIWKYWNPDGTVQKIERYDNGIFR